MKQPGRKSAPALEASGSPTTNVPDKRSPRQVISRLRKKSFDVTPFNGAPLLVTFDLAISNFRSTCGGNQKKEKKIHKNRGRAKEEKREEKNESNETPRPIVSHQTQTYLCKSVCVHSKIALEAAVLPAECKQPAIYRLVPDGPSDADFGTDSRAQIVSCFFPAIVRPIRDELCNQSAAGLLFRRANFPIYRRGGLSRGWKCWRVTAARNTAGNFDIT